MVRIFGKALVASWRPYESGGSSQMRSSQMECDSVTVLDQVVLAQHPDGFWETMPLGNCSVIWQGKPSVSVIGADGAETPLAVQGKEKTLADELMHGGAHATHQSRFSAPLPTPVVAVDAGEAVEI
jgi:hypothetical protein